MGGMISAGNVCLIGGQTREQSAPSKGGKEGSPGLSYDARNLREVFSLAKKGANFGLGREHNTSAYEEGANQI
jgi:hypothetical protein